MHCALNRANAVIIISFSLQYDMKISKADTLVKQTVVLSHYFNVAVARFKDSCVNGEIVEEQRSSLEDCIVGLKTKVKEESKLLVGTEMVLK